MRSTVWLYEGYICDCTVLDLIGHVVVSQDDESLRKWKEQLLGNIDLTDVGGSHSLIGFCECMQSNPVCVCFRFDQRFSSRT